MRSMNCELSSLLRTSEVRQFVPRHTDRTPAWACRLLLAFWDRPSKYLCSEMLMLGTHLLDITGDLGPLAGTLKASPSGSDLLMGPVRSQEHDETRVGAKCCHGLQEKGPRRATGGLAA